MLRKLRNLKWLHEESAGDHILRPEEVIQKYSGMFGFNSMLVENLYSQQPIIIPVPANGEGIYTPYIQNLGLAEHNLWIVPAPYDETVPFVIGRSLYSFLNLTNKYKYILDFYFMHKFLKVYEYSLTWILKPFTNYCILLD